MKKMLGEQFNVIRRIFIVATATRTHKPDIT